LSDVFDGEKRSAIMKAVLSKGNKSTEQKLIHLFNENHITGWRRNYKVIGHPDFVFPKQRVAIFVDGCFWHGHDCRNTRPKANEEYWTKKRERNMKHDREVTALFEKRGWTVLRIWECELKKKNQPATLLRITNTLCNIKCKEAEISKAL
jgi:DNA mismatch endonuclease (patch repair protein)